MGGGGSSNWCARHIKAVMNIGGPLLGAPKAVTGLFSTEAKDVVARVGIPTERAYVYKLSPSSECYIPFQIDGSAEDEERCLNNGVYLVDGDETVPVLSAGFMCAKGWRCKTRFNPSGIRTYIREYHHSPPANLLEGRGTQSGDHVGIMGNFALIEDIIRVAAGASGEDLGGDQFYSDIFKWSERINLKL